MQFVDARFCASALMGQFVREYNPKFVKNGDHPIMEERELL
jgi:hypothetical protein